MPPIYPAERHAPLPMPPKDPDARVDYEFDFSKWLAAGESIINAVFTVPAGITSASESSTATSATIFLSGGTAGSDYVVTCRITTDSTPNRITDRSIVVPVRER